ncbi:lyr motif-containing protein 4 [Plakobranchus ocellatus]|uniref:Lyr motif-containing protein 4 n=1 Tax=Plakobranchus ocellatus TaxID=259542 RepID=A0AAV3ZNK5_9GAST|nr:lyr motif-containing protein 4 [Plakobranchus ocellatus]
MAASMRTSVLSLYKQLLKESGKLSDYNFRAYAIRRTKDAFKENKNITDSKQIQSLIQKAQENLEVLKRQAIVSQLYGSTKIVIESPKPA